MKYLPKFDYIVPGSLQEFCQFFENHSDDTRILAGGTDLLLSLKKGEERPAFVVDITRIAELSRSERRRRFYFYRSRNDAYGGG